MPTRRGGRRSGAIPCCRLGDRAARTIRRALRAPPVKVAAYSVLLGAQKGKAFPESSGLLRRQLRDPVDELFGVDRRAGTVERHIGTGPETVIGDRLHIVGLSQDLAQLATEPGLVSGQPGKLGVHALVAFSIFARALHYQGLRRVKGRKVGISARVFACSGGETSSRAGRALPGLVEMPPRFR